MNSLRFLILIGGFSSLIGCIFVGIIAYRTLRLSRASIVAKVEQAERELLRHIRQIDETELRQTEAGRTLLAMHVEQMYLKSKSGEHKAFILVTTAALFGFIGLIVATVLLILFRSALLWVFFAFLSAFLGVFLGTALLSRGLLTEQALLHTLDILLERTAEKKES